MGNGTDLAVAGLGLLGGGALGAAIGGALSGLARWDGARLTALVASFCLVGAGLGVVMIGGASVANVAAMLPRADRFADETRSLAVLKAHYPDDYAAATKVLADARRDGASRDQADAALRRISTPLIQRQLPLASTANALTMLRITRDEQRQLARDPQLCFRSMMQPGAVTPDTFTAIATDDVKRREGELIPVLLEQTATHPQPPRPPADLDRKLRLWTADGVGALSMQDRALLANLNSTPTDAQAKAVCDILGNVLDGLLAASPDDAAEAFKAISAKGMQRIAS
jgi:hypothetical protein